VKSQQNLISGFFLILFSKEVKTSGGVDLFFNNFLSSNLALKIGGKLENPVQTGFLFFKKLSVC